MRAQIKNGKSIFVRSRYRDRGRPVIGYCYRIYLMNDGKLSELSDLHAANAYSCSFIPFNTYPLSLDRVK